MFDKGYVQRKRPYRDEKLRQKMEEEVREYRKMREQRRLELMKKLREVEESRSAVDAATPVALEPIQLEFDFGDK